MKKVFFALMILAMVFALLGCAAEQPAPPAEPDAPAESDQPAAPEDEPATSDEVFHLTVNTHLLDGTIMTDGMEEYFAELEVRTNGRVVVDQFVFGGALLQGDAVLDGLGTGVADAAFITTTIASDRLLMSTALLPCYYTNFGGAIEAQNHIWENSEELQNEYLQYNIIPIYFMNGNDSIIETSFEMDIMGDKPFLGKKIYAPGTSNATAIERLGAVPVSLAVSECYAAMQKGTVEGGAVSGGYGLKSNKYGEVNDYAYDFRKSGTSMWMGVGMNLDTYNSFPDDIKQIIADMASFGGEVDTRLWYDLTMDAYNWCLDECDMTFIQLTEEEADHWLDLMDPQSIWEANIQAAEAAGYTSVREWMDYLTAALDEYQAAGNPTKMEQFFELRPEADNYVR